MAFMAGTPVSRRLMKGLPLKGKLAPNRLGALIWMNRGVLLAAGSAVGGYALYAQNSKLACEFNCFRSSVTKRNTCKQGLEA
jgi:hypothetical protein